MKKISILLFALFLTITIAGCEKTDNNNTNQEDSQDSVVNTSKIDKWKDKAEVIKLNEDEEVYTGGLIVAGDTSSEYQDTEVTVTQDNDASMMDDDAALNTADAGDTSEEGSDTDNNAEDGEVSDEELSDYLESNTAYYIFGLAANSPNEIYGGGIDLTELATDITGVVFIDPYSLEAMGSLELNYQPSANLCIDSDPGAGCDSKMTVTNGSYDILGKIGYLDKYVYSSMLEYGSIPLPTEGVKIENEITNLLALDIKLYEYARPKEKITMWNEYSGASATPDFNYIYIQSSKLIDEGRGFILVLDGEGGFYNNNFSSSVASNLFTGNIFLYFYSPSQINTLNSVAKERLETLKEKVAKDNIKAEKNNEPQLNS